MPKHFRHSLIYVYRVNQQCCPGGNCPETLRGWCPDILAKSLANPENSFNFFIIIILSGFTSDLAKKSGDPPRGVSGGSPDDFRRDIIAGPHGTYNPHITSVVEFLEWATCFFELYTHNIVSRILTAEFRKAHNQSDCYENKLNKT